MSSLVQYMQSRTHTVPRNAHTNIPLTKIPAERYHPKYITQKTARKYLTKKTQSSPALWFYTLQSHATTETGFCKRQYPVSRNCCSFRQKCYRPELSDTSSITIRNKSSFLLKGKSCRVINLAITFVID